MTNLITTSKNLSFFQFLSNSKKFLEEAKFDFTVKDTTAHSFDIIAAANRFTKTTQLGSGVEAVAYFNENTQTVLKVIKFNSELQKYELKHESTYRYLKEITKEFNTGNPYFPKIYSIRFFEYSLGESETHIYGVVQMERLYSINDFNKESLVGAIRNTGYDEYIEDYNETSPNLIQEFLFNISQFLRGNNPAFIKSMSKSNPKFTTAMAVIRKLIKKYDFRPDLHEGNMMIRLTNKGPMLVFTDPLIPQWWLR
jgi:hypothetical protein